MGASASVGAAPTPTPDEVAEAEAKALEAGKVHVELTMRAKALRLLHTARVEPERVGLRAVGSMVARFMLADKQRAMAKYDWYAEVVRDRQCQGYTLEEEEGGWQIVDSDDGEADVFLQKLDGGAVAGAGAGGEADGGADTGGEAETEAEAAAPAKVAYTVTSVFGTRYDSLLADGKQLVFSSWEDFLVRFPSSARLDLMVEAAAVASEEEEEEDEEEERERESRKERREAEESEIDGPAADEALRKEALRLVSDRVWREACEASIRAVKLKNPGDWEE